MTVAVYPKIEVYCPKTKQKQDGSYCKACEYYNSYHNEEFIDCRYD